MTLVGCSSPAPKPVVKADEPKKESENPLVGVPTNTGQIVITARDVKGQTLWVARAQSSSTLVSEDNKAVEDLKNVDGELYESGTVVCHFSGDSAHADQAKRKLDLAGNVKVTSEKFGLTLESDTVRLIPNADESKELVAALGSVKVLGASADKQSPWSLEPGGELWCTKSLSKLGAPEQFK